jgi:hypothetical protein
MAPIQITNEGYMELVESQGTVVAAISLPETRIPRVGECITLPAGADPAGARYEVEHVTYCYGHPMGLQDLITLLKVTLKAKRV